MLIDRYRHPFLSYREKQTKENLFYGESLEKEIHRHRYTQVYVASTLLFIGSPPRRIRPLASCTVFSAPPSFRSLFLTIRNKASCRTLSPSQVNIELVPKIPLMIRLNENRTSSVGLGKGPKHIYKDSAEDRSYHQATDVSRYPCTPLLAPISNKIQNTALAFSS